MTTSARHEPQYRRVEVMCTDRAWRPVEMLAGQVPVRMGSLDQVAGRLRGLAFI